MIKKILLIISVVFGFLAVVVGYAYGITQCATTIYALEGDDIVADDIYKWIDSGHIGWVPTTDDLGLGFSANDTFYQQLSITNGYSNDLNDLSSSEYFDIFIEWDGVGLSFIDEDEMNTLATFNFNSSTHECISITIFYTYISFANDSYWNDEFLSDLLITLLVPYDFDYSVPINIYVNNNLVGTADFGVYLSVYNYGEFGSRIINNSNNSTLYTYPGTLSTAFGGYIYDGSTYVNNQRIRVGTNSIYLTIYTIDYSPYYNSGYQNGYNVGYPEGYDDGLADGQSLTYQQGYDDGLVDNGNAKLGNVWQTLLNMVNSFFSLEIFPGFKLVYILYFALGGIGLAIAIKLWVH